MTNAEEKSATDVKVRRKRSMPPKRISDMKVAVVVRRQTPDEQRQFEAAAKLFLAELVRQHMRQTHHE